MSRRPEQCRFRAPLDLDGGVELALCGMVTRITGVDEPDTCVVGRDACEACCRSLLPGEDLNPVVASLVFQATGAILRAGGKPGCDPEKAQALRDRIVNHLGIVCPGIEDRAFPPEAPPRENARRRSLTPSRRVSSGLTWAVGVITAPRKTPTLHRTLRSLVEAGFGPVHIFAEPGSWIPPEASAHRLEVHGRRLGNFPNFYTSLASLYHRNRDAECIAIFQDDIRAAVGLKSWCDAQLWPLGAGLVSLFTPRVHSDERTGWRLRTSGFFRVFGGQALVFRRDLLESFLADPHVLRQVEDCSHFDDAVVSAWATRRHSPIAYHTPSLVQHIGVVSSIYERGPDPRVFADAVDRVDQIEGWRPPARRPGKVGLVGWDAQTGLGYQNHDLATHLEVDRWLVPPHPYCPDAVGHEPGCRVDRVPLDVGRDTLRRWFRGLDWVLFIEQPFLPRLAKIARSEGVGVACVPNWEWLQPRQEWLPFIDLMLCPTRHTYAHVCDWRRRYGFGWDVRLVPWPVDAARFPFRERRRCERFVFANGWGGGLARRLDGSTVGYGRKGLELIAEAAWMAPHLPFIVYSQHRDLPKLPGNVELRPPTADNRRLYEDGDVCVQPSHFEGLGLQLLECQAAGMPLVTTDAPPMNEYETLATIPVTGAEIVQFGYAQPFAAQLMTAEDLVRVLDGLLGTDITQASRRARAFIDREHSWERALPLLRESLVVL